MDAVYRYLDGLPSFQVQGARAARLGLDRIREFCRRMENPEKKIPVVHVAGSNGKGSVCVMLSRIYEQAGYRCGLYTSPHLETVRERFRINGGMITEQAMLRFFKSYGGVLQELDLSYFEITTALAFWWFAVEEVDVAIVETGLGGRLDATNIVNPMVSVITAIGHDHQHFLGNTLAEIAAEKAGIIKKGRPVVVGDLPRPALETVRRIAGERGSPVFPAYAKRPGHTPGGSTAAKGYTYFVDRDGDRLEIPTDLMAPVHKWNIAMASLVTELNQQRFPISGDQFCRALLNIMSDKSLPARFERLLPDHHWYFDGAHNPQAVRQLMQSISGMGWSREPVVVLSIMKDKATKKMLEPFSVFKKNYYYSLHTERAADIAHITPHLPDVAGLPPTEEEIVHFFAGLNKEVVIFTGSFYFYSVVRRWIYLIKAR